MSEFRLPELGEGVYEAELVAWLVKPGDRVKRGQGLMEAMTDKATMEVPSPFAGTITALQAEPGQKLKVGQVIMEYTGTEQGDGGPTKAAEKIETTQHADKQPSTHEPRNSASVAASNARSPGTVKAGPAVRYMARNLGIDLARVRGSGPGGRILIDDLSSQVKTAESNREPPADLQPRPDYGTPGTRIRMIGLRRKIAEHLVLSKRTIPHYTYVDECDVTEMVHLREALRDPYTRAGIKLTYLVFFIKAAAAALKEVPMVNASLDEQAGEIVLHEKYHIGIAVATPTGLIVPVIHDADQKTPAQLAAEVERLTTEARAGKSRLEDLRGGTFTITSIGNIGGLFSTPVINHPEVGILGIGKVVKRPVYDKAGNLRPADRVYLSFSFDHRVVDGAIGAAFGNAVIRQLQNPAALMLGDRVI